MADVKFVSISREGFFPKEIASWHKAFWFCSSYSCSDTEFSRSIQQYLPTLNATVNSGCLGQVSCNCEGYVDEFLAVNEELKKMRESKDSVGQLVWFMGWQNCKQLLGRPTRTNGFEKPIEGQQDGDRGWTTNAVAENRQGSHSMEGSIKGSHSTKGSIKGYMEWQLNCNLMASSCY